MTSAEDSLRLSPGESEFLHRLRAVLALLVLVGHVRSRVWGSYGDLGRDESLIEQVVFFFTGLGAPAVTLFFVLSGYLITRFYLVPLARGDLTVRTFAAERAVRLYLVLVPALLFSWGCQRWGHHAGEGDVGTFVKNLFFLQPGRAAPFAGNDPLWSLGYEGLAYVFFGSVAVAIQAIRRKQVASLVVAACLALGLLLGVGFWALHYFAIWSLGAVAALVRLEVQGRAPRWVFVVAASATVAAMVAARFGFASPLREWAIGVPGSIVIATMSVAPLGRLKQSRWARPLSRMSYTLYVTHFPLALIAAQVAVTPQTPGLGALWFLGVTALCLMVAWVFAQATEHQTSRVRRWFGIAA